MKKLLSVLAIVIKTVIWVVIVIPVGVIYIVCDSNSRYKQWDFDPRSIVKI